ncbi:MAG: ribonuclease Y [Blautia sp.]|nr:ribonuclease Y [Blautia sp.]
MAGTIIAVIVAVLVALLISVPLTYKLSIAHKAQQDALTVGTAEDKARSIIDEAIKQAESKKKEALLEVKEETFRTKKELESETKERRNELQNYEKRVLQKEETVDKKAEAVEKREQEYAVRIGKLQEKEKKVDELEAQAQTELERVAGLTSEEAKAELYSSVEGDVRKDIAKLYKELEAHAKDDAAKKAQEYVVNAIQRSAVDHVSETTISVVQLPNDEMKGRIIGREGRNIRTLETMTGVDLIIDDTPEAVVLSSFDPIRREVARIALERLIVDGRIHPARIEETVERARREVEAKFQEDGEDAALEVGLHNIHPELLKLLGKMKFRFSYGQNALKHSIEVAQLCGLLAGEIGLDVRLAKRAGLLHDIGKSVDHEIEGSHIQLGVDLCKKYKESPIVINAVAAHHGDYEPESLIACIVQAADAISAARPGARRESLETYTTRLKQLEEITSSYKGVDKSFAIQAGREVRVMVIPEQVSDTEMVLMAREIATRIENELEYPGQIKVNVIRESRASEIAK